MLSPAWYHVWRRYHHERRPRLAQTPRLPRWKGPPSPPSAEELAERAALDAEARRQLAGPGLAHDDTPLGEAVGAGEEYMVQLMVFQAVLSQVRG